MSPVLVAALVLLGLLLVLNLLLTTAVIRKLRRHDELLRDFDGSAPLSVLPQIRVGAPVPDFTTEATDGQLTEADLRSTETLIAFAAPGCGGCEAARPRLIEMLEARRRRGEAGIVVIADDEGDGGTLVGEFSAHARVIVEHPADGAIHQALGIAMYPNYVLVGADGRVTRVGGDLDEIAAAVPIRS
ncbi:TlpA family protein disulfide reductase [Kribbella sp. CA-293567]|uniref:TlpA family protein disulfide reductase n=1 Tax=Kribbella sp. CA-293567 TaxID=3002436 RepID=UPI0022DCEB89|nr:redoxin family protein [Kribbella sp. CA-293567]WBQ01971.1 redoxin family protein [Kribbella sp. CA-293567]